MRLERSWLRAPTPLLRRLMAMSAVACLAGTSLLLAAWLYPIDRSVEQGMQAAASRVPQWMDLRQDLNPLLVQMSGRRLIRPAQVQAAVRDTGAAQRLLGQLKLQGVVQMGDHLVAYVRVDKQGTRSVREGEKLLDFMVEKIVPGTVHLSLEGVEVNLTH